MPANSCHAWFFRLELYRPTIVSKKPANKVGRERSTAELAEKRELAKDNLRQQASHRIQSRGRRQRALERIRQAVDEPRLRVST